MSEKQRGAEVQKPKEWYINKKGKEYGPYTGRELKSLAVSGKLDPADKVRTDARYEWSSAEDVKGLFPKDEDGNTVSYSGREMVRFRSELKKLTPVPYVMYGIIMINVLIFIVISIITGTILEPDIETLIKWGANFGPKTLGGEWWRLFTCMFLHGGLLHVAFNMWVLWDAGNLVERMTGNIGFAVMYTGSGLIGSLASLVWNPYVVSVGASGAVFGVYGALLGFFTVKRKSIPSGIWRPLSKSAVLFIGYNMVYGVFRPGIDVAAHVGGLGGGFLFGLAMAQDLKKASGQSRLVRNAASGIAAVIVIAAVCFMIGGEVADIQTEINAFGTVEEKVLNGLHKKAADLEKGAITEEAFAEYIDKHTLPDWTKAYERFKKNVNGQKVPSRYKDLVKLLSDYIRLRQEAWTLFVEGVRTRDEEKKVEAGMKQMEAEALALGLNAAE